ncbi:MAG: PAS domain S-box protein, partial [Candidatus Rokuibacteriota bacterium]
MLGRLAEILEATPDFVGVADLSLRMVYLNPAGRKMLGLSGELNGQSLSGLAAPSSVDKLIGEAVPAALAASLWRGELALRASGGRDISVSLVLLAHLDPQGRPLYLSAVARDIGDLKRVASQLSIAQSIARMGSWDHDLEKGDLMWSEETCRIFGLPPGEPVTPAKFWSVIHPEDSDRVRAASEEARRTGKPYRVEHRIVRPDGSERFVEERAEVRYDHARRPVRMIGTVQDVTDQRRLEEQLRHAQRMDAVGRLAGGVAHDFNNMLTVICGHAENLRSSLAGRPELLESADEILKAGGRATSLTRQLLSFGRQSVLAVRTLSVTAVVEDLRKMLVRLLGDVVDLRL